MSHSLDGDGMMKTTQQEWESRQGNKNQGKGTSDKRYATFNHRCGQGISTISKWSNHTDMKNPSTAYTKQCTMYTYYRWRMQCCIYAIDIETDRLAISSGGRVRTCWRPKIRLARMRQWILVCLNIGSPIPPEKEFFNLSTLGLRPRTLEPVNNVVVENLVVETIVPKFPEGGTWQCKSDLSIYC